MTKRERIINAIRHRESDIIPHNIDFTQEEYEKVARETGDKMLYRTIDNHILACGIGGFYPIEGRKDFYADDFGVVWNRTRDKDIGVVDRILIGDAEQYDVVFPVLDEKAIRRDIETIVKGAKEDGQFAVFNISFSMFERAWILRGMENLLMDFIENPEFVHRLLNDICEYHLKAIDIAIEYDGIDGIMFGDDWGQQKGLIMGVGYWREFIKPYVARMYARVKSKGKFVLQHSCGDIESIFNDLIDMGLDVYQTFQPEIYDIERVKRDYGDRLTFWGGISTQRLLPYADSETVAKETRRIMSVMGKNGGYIASPTHAMPKDIPTENVVAMLDVFLNQ